MENIDNNEEQQSQSRKRQASDSSGSSDCSSRESSTDKSSKVAKRSRQKNRLLDSHICSPFNGQPKSRVIYEQGRRNQVESPPRINTEDFFDNVSV
ncbi:unnamed protein product [Euphydryas editha]|uniref:Uncharacterized protein n=1 Tax=Euphydryas editha TaxID=104508 RepID=A0AAU9U3V1_EUPED|nr:unnamed protein product [Euphydryas editha]